MIFARKNKDGSLSLTIHEGEAPISLPSGANLKLKEIADSEVNLTSINSDTLKIGIQLPSSSSPMQLSIDPEKPALMPYIRDASQITSIEGLVYAMRKIENGRM